MSQLSIPINRPETYGALSLAMKHIDKARNNRWYGKKHISKAQKLVAKASQFEGKTFCLTRGGWYNLSIEERFN